MLKQASKKKKKQFQYMLTESCFLSANGDQLFFRLFKLILYTPISKKKILFKLENDSDTGLNKIMHVRYVISSLQSNI
jgi:hypothetical protein